MEQGQDPSPGLPDPKVTTEGRGMQRGLGWPSVTEHPKGNSSVIMVCGTICLVLATAESSISVKKLEARAGRGDGWTKTMINLQVL